MLFRPRVETRGFFVSYGTDTRTKLKKATNINGTETIMIHQPHK